MITCMKPWRSKRGRCMSLMLSALVMCSTVGIYAFFALDITKVDVSGPDPDGPVIVPENYQNLLVLDVTVPAVDAGNAGEDILLHNGVAGSHERDVLRPFAATDWYSDHDGDAAFDGNKVSGNTEAIVSSSDDMLDSSDVVRKTGLCFLETFDYSNGIGEQHIDSNHSDSYNDGETILRTVTSAGEVHPGEVIRSGAADMTSFHSSIRFTDGMNGNVTPRQYDHGEAIIVSDDGILDPGDTILTPGNADLSPFPGGVAYSDFDGDGRYEDEEFIISDAGIAGQLDMGPLDGTGVDTVIRPGRADLRAMDDDLFFADDNGDNEFSPGELIVSSADLSVDIGEVKLPGTANLKPLTDLSVAGMVYSDIDDSNTYSDGELKINSDDQTLDAGDEVVSPGEARLLLFRDHWYIDADDEDDFDWDEAIVHEGNGDTSPRILDDDDNIAKAGSVNLRSFNDKVVYIDHNTDNGEGTFQGDSGNEVNWDDADDDTFANDPDITKHADEVVLDDGGVQLALDSADSVLRPGMARLTVFSENCVYIDDNSDGYFTPGEAVIMDVNEPPIPDADNLTPFQRAEKFVDGNANQIYDPGEAIIYDWYKSKDDPEGEFILAGDAVSVPVDASLAYQPPGSRNGDCVLLASAPGSAAMIQFNDTAEYKYIDNNDTGVVSSYDGFYSNYEPIIWSANDQLEEGDLDGTGTDHLLAAGYADMKSWTGSAENMAWTDDDGDGEYQSNEAIVYDAEGDGIIASIGTEAADDQIIVSGDANLQVLIGADHKYSDANDDNEYTDGELIVDDLNDDDNVDAGEIVRAGVANLKAFAADVMYLDDDGDGVYSDSEAITRTEDVELGSDDEVLTPGAAGLSPFAINIYRYTDADHDNVYDQGEAIVVEAGWGAVNDTLEDSDIVVLAGAADIERFPSSFMFLDDGANSNAYEDGEALVNDVNGNDLLDADEIITGGRAGLREFAGSEKYTDAGDGTNARNSQYDQDEAIVQDGNYNDRLDAGLLNGAGNDTVISAGKAGLTQFDSDGLPEPPNCDDEHYVDADGNNRYDGSEDIYLDRDNNDMVTIGNDALGYFVVENSGTATNSDLAAVKLWADRDNNGRFEPNADDAPAVVSLVPDASSARRWYEGPATAPPLSVASARASIDYTIYSDEQRLFVTVDIGSTPTDGAEIQMVLPLNGVRTVFGSPGPSDTTIANAYAQTIDYANPDTAEMTSPPANAVLDGQIVLKADVSDTVQVGKVEFYNGPPGGANNPIAVDEDGAPWEALWDSSGAGPGLHTLYARVYDRTYLRPPQTWGISHYIDSQGVPITIVAESYSVQLADGWNLISVPVEAFDTSIGSVVSLIDGDCIAFWGYDVSTSEWLRYDLSEPDFLNDLDEVHVGSGYWALMDGPGTLNIPGNISGSLISLQAGWNLVGCNSLTPLDMANATNSIECEFEVWTINETTGNWLGYAPGDPFNDLDVIEPGRGYWFYVSRDCIWNISE
ncbi:Ig-like domain-containing protein [Candidatus Poribacteria bacterium]